MKVRFGRCESTTVVASLLRIAYPLQNVWIKGRTLFLIKRPSFYVWFDKVPAETELRRACKGRRLWTCNIPVQKMWLQIVKDREESAFIPWIQTYVPRGSTVARLLRFRYCWVQERNYTMWQTKSIELELKTKNVSSGPGPNLILSASNWN